MNGDMWIGRSIYASCVNSYLEDQNILGIALELSKCKGIQPFLSEAELRDR